MASFLWDASSFTKYGFKFMMNMLDTKMFITTSINDCLWNLTDPLVHKAKTMMPGLVPEENMGILYQVNDPPRFVYVNRRGFRWVHKKVTLFERFESQACSIVNQKQLCKRLCRVAISRARGTNLIHHSNSSSCRRRCIVFFIYNMLTLFCCSYSYSRIQLVNKHTSCVHINRILHNADFYLHLFDLMGAWTVIMPFPFFSTNF